MTKQKSSHIRLSADNNFFKFPIPIIESLLKAGLNGSEWSIIMFIIRQTYGWGKQSDIITIKQFQANTNLKKNAIMTALKKFKKLGWINIEKQTFKDGGHKANKITILLGVDVVNENNKKRAEKIFDMIANNNLTNSQPCDSVEAITGIQMDTHSVKTGIQMDTHSVKTGIQMDTHNGYPKTDLTIDIKNQYIEESIDRRESIDRNSPPAVSKTRPSGDRLECESSPSLSEEELEQHKLYKKDLRNRLSLLSTMKEKEEYFEAGASQEFLQKTKELLQKFEGDLGVMCISKMEFEDFEWRVRNAIFRGQSVIDKKGRKTA